MCIWRDNSEILWEKKPWYQLCFKSQRDDSRVFKDLVWIYGSDACGVMCAAIHFFKFVRIFKVFSCVPRLRYLSSSLFLPAACHFILSSSPVHFHLLLERESVFHLNCQIFTLKYIHRLHWIQPKSAYIFISLSPSPPSCPCVAVDWLLFSGWFSSDLLTWRFVNGAWFWTLACCPVMNLSNSLSLESRPESFPPQKNPPARGGRKP